MIPHNTVFLSGVAAARSVAATESKSLPRAKSRGPLPHHKRRCSPRTLGVNQPAISKLERRAEMYVSTLQDFVRALGGELKITAKFPEGTVEIRQFEDARKVAADKD